MIVDVKSPARLHLGLTELGGHFGRMYGGVGVGVEQPSCRVRVECWEGLEVDGHERDYVKTLAARLEKILAKRLTGRITVLETIPAHVGLGSRTQLSLSVSTALCKANGLNPSTRLLAGALGRGSVSGVGVAVFENGGFVVDMPKRINSGRVSGYLRMSFPGDWAFAVAYPLHDKGPSDEQEAELFNRLPAMPDEKCASLSHLVLGKLLPALADKDAEEFGEALTELQKIVGSYFSQVQGGVYKRPEPLKVLEECGALGLGQSSWGPAVYGFFSSFQDAEEAVSRTREQLGDGWVVFATRANNKGVQTSVLP
ncbi:MAG: hypothetical protein QXH11_00970 [Candidatus Caldarchaeum sp.]